MSEPVRADGSKVLPVYIVVDVSWSMSGEPIKAANQIVPELINACTQYTTVRDMLWFSLITFSDTAKTLIPMTSYENVTPPLLEPENSTEYGAAFREIRSNIDHDVEFLKLHHHVVLRPSVFFITDGEPTDNDQLRQAAWDDLTDKTRKTHPNIVMFGVGDKVSGDMLKRYVSHRGKAFITRTESAADGLRSIIEMLVMSVVASTGSAAAGSNEGLILDFDGIDDDLEEVM